jgi:hypothetical protein
MENLKKIAVIYILDGSTVIGAICLDPLYIKSFSQDQDGYYEAKTFISKFLPNEVKTLEWEMRAVNTEIKAFEDILGSDYFHYMKIDYVKRLYPAIEAIINKAVSIENRWAEINKVANRAMMKTCYLAVGKLTGKVYGLSILTHEEDLKDEDFKAKRCDVMSAPIGGQHIEPMEHKIVNLPAGIHNNAGLRAGYFYTADFLYSIGLLDREETKKFMKSSEHILGDISRN